jgi:hypothetical protein
MSQQDATAGGLAENFADGRNPQDKGDAKRHGVPTKASVSTLRKVAKQGGRKGQLAHWMANMKAGKAKNEDITDEQGVAEDVATATEDQVWTKGPNTYLLHRTNSSHRLINQNGKSVAEFKVPLRYIEAHLEDQGFRLSKTSAMSRRDPNWFNSTVGMAEAAHTTNFNDDDWYEIDPGTKTVVSQRGPQAYQMPSGQRQIKLPNGNIVVRGMRAKYMDLDTGLGKSTR